MLSIGYQKICIMSRKKKTAVPISDYWANRFIEILRSAQNDVSILVILKERQRLKNLDQALEKLEQRGVGDFPHALTDLLLPRKLKQVRGRYFLLTQISFSGIIYESSAAEY